MPVERPERTRRKYIMAVGSIAFGVLAGCSGDGGSDGNGGGNGSDGGNGGTDSADGGTNGDRTDGGDSGTATQDRSRTDGTGQLELIGVEWVTEGAYDGPMFELRNTGSSPVSVRYVRRTTGASGSLEPSNVTADDMEFTNWGARNSTPYKYTVEGGETIEFIVGAGYRVESAEGEPCDGLEVPQTYEFVDDDGNSLPVEVTVRYETRITQGEEDTFICDPSEVVDVSTAS